MSQVILIQPMCAHPITKFAIGHGNIPPLGLGYIAAVLLKNGIDTKVIDMQTEGVDLNRVENIISKTS